MPDKYSKETRSRMMSGIKNKNTKPEIMIRRELFGNGFRYRLHNGKLPGKPDLVLKKYMAIVFIHGCFWHRHNCHYFVWPKSNTEFWREKINGNKRNDQKVIKQLQSMGYRICIFWECVTRDNEMFPKAMKKLVKWLPGKSKFLELSI
jgi:DNA mismatch endonuclease (patch repair protein)